MASIMENGEKCLLQRRTINPTRLEEIQQLWKRRKGDYSSRRSRRDHAPNRYRRTLKGPESISKRIDQALLLIEKNYALLNGGTGSGSQQKEEGRPPSYDVGGGKLEMAKEEGRHLEGGRRRTDDDHYMGGSNVSEGDDGGCVGDGRGSLVEIMSRGMHVTPPPASLDMGVPKAEMESSSGMKVLPPPEPPDRGGYMEADGSLAIEAMAEKTVAWQPRSRSTVERIWTPTTLRLKPPEQNAAVEEGGRSNGLVKQPLSPTTEILNTCGRENEARAAWALMKLGQTFSQMGQAQQGIESSLELGDKDVFHPIIEKKQSEMAEWEFGPKLTCAQPIKICLTAASKSGRWVEFSGLGAKGFLSVVGYEPTLTLVTNAGGWIGNSTAKVSKDDDVFILMVANEARAEVTLYGEYAGPILPPETPIILPSTIPLAYVSQLERKLHNEGKSLKFFDSPEENLDGNTYGALLFPLNHSSFNCSFSVFFPVISVNGSAKTFLVFDQVRENFLSLRKSTEIDSTTVIKEKLQNARTSFEGACFNIGWQLLHHTKPFIGEVLDKEQISLYTGMEEYKSQVYEGSRLFMNGPYYFSSGDTAHPFCKIAKEGIDVVMESAANGKVQIARQGYPPPAPSSYLRGHWKRRYFVFNSQGVLYFNRKPWNKSHGSSQPFAQRNNITKNGSGLLSQWLSSGITAAAQDTEIVLDFFLFDPGGTYAEYEGGCAAIVNSGPIIIDPTPLMAEVNYTTGVEVTSQNNFLNSQISATNFQDNACGFLLVHVVCISPICDEMLEIIVACCKQYGAELSSTKMGLRGHGSQLSGFRQWDPGKSVLKKPLTCSP